MEIFVNRQNTSRFRDLLLRVTDEDQREQIHHCSQKKKPKPSLEN